MGMIRIKAISEKELTHFRHFGRDAEIQHKDVKPQSQPGAAKEPRASFRITVHGLDSGIHAGMTVCGFHGRVSSFPEIS